MRNGYVKIRAGLEEHLVSGRLSYFEAGVYVVIHLQADFRTGVWVGSAPRLMATAPRGATLRAVQRAIEHLVEIGFLRVFHTPGARGNYHVLIDKYGPQCGALKGKRLNAYASSDWRMPVYESVAEGVAEGDAEDAPSLRSRSRSSRSAPQNGARKAQAKPGPSPSCFVGTHLTVSNQQDRLLGEAFPWVERPAEYRKADAWLEANPGRRPRKAARFLQNWFARIVPNGKAQHAPVEAVGSEASLNQESTRLYEQLGVEVAR